MTVSASVFAPTSTLRSRIESRDAVIGVIGLGYVGLPVACEFARVGFRVVGLEIKAERVAMINAGVNPIEGDEPGLAELLTEVTRQGRLHSTSDYAALHQADVITINVDTPVDENHRPQYVALKAACTSLGAVLKPGALVIVESTVAPGTVNGVVAPILEQMSGMRANVDFYLGACPERVMPGKLLANLRGLSRVCGGGAPEVAQVMATLYRAIIPQADLDLTDIVTAELVKTTENAYRDVNIAFANEVALICEAVGGDVWKVRELVNKSPGRQMLLPGAGVGGHCIPKDPWLLAHAADGKFTPRLIPAAREVNESMPHHVADLAICALADAGKQIDQARVAVLGVAYLENSDDTRNSPSMILVDHLRSLGAEVVLHDPWVEAYKGNLVERIQGCDAAIVMVAHREYMYLDLDRLQKTLKLGILIDGRGIFTAADVHGAGMIYIGIGRAS